MEQIVVESGLERNGFRAALLTEDQFDLFWPKIEEMLDLLPHTWEDLTKTEIIVRAHDGTLQVWGVGDKETFRMVLFTQVAAYSAGRVLQIIWGAGQGGLHEVAGDAVDAALEYYAKTQACKRIDIIGRLGWERVLHRRGFKCSAVVLSRKIIHGGMQ